MLQETLGDVEGWVHSFFWFLPSHVGCRPPFERRLLVVWHAASHHLQVTKRGAVLMQLRAESQKDTKFRRVEKKVPLSLNGEPSE